MKEGTLKEYGRLIRLPSSLGISIIGGIGALSVKGNNVNILPLVVLLLIGVIVNIYGYVLNDYMDVSFDKQSKELYERPLVKGTISKKAALTIIFTCLIVIFIIPTFFFRSILLIFILMISIVLGTFYDMFCKRIVCAEFFLAGAMASFCLFGAVAVSSDLKDLFGLGSLTWIVITIMFLYVLIMVSLEGNFKDVETDRKTGAVTLPIFLGVRTSNLMNVPLCYKLLLIFIKVILIFLIFTPFIFLEYSYWNWQIFILVILSFGMIWSMIMIFNQQKFDKEKIALNSRRHGIISYFVFPFLLINFVGFEWAIFLTLYPLIWPLLFNYILYGKSLTPAAYIK
jgi:4-hydroxybenzoate polyprenyltransferase